MRPAAEVQIRWGAAGAALALVVLCILAFVPDPLFRQRVFVTRFDDVDLVTVGAPVYFSGAQLGAVRSVKLDPESGQFNVQLGVRRAWRPGDCAFARIHETNPFAAPRVELVATPARGAACPAALKTAACDALAPPPRGGRPLYGCRRPPGLFETASVAVARAAEVAQTANLMAAQVQKLMAGGPGGLKGVDYRKLASDLTQTLASINGMTSKLDASLTPNRGDLARTLANARLVSDRVTTVDVANLNATLANTREMVSDMQGLIRQNQANINGLLSESATISAQTRGLLENASSSMTATSGSLERASDNLELLSERLSADPTYVLRGQRYADPPPPGGGR